MTQGKSEALPAHLRSLTSLRFFAALMVVVLHTATRFDAISGLRLVSGAGYAGVTFFFVLSGFVLTWSHRLGDSAGGFYWRRFARIYPLHLLTLVLAIGIAVVVGPSTNWVALPFALTLTHAWFLSPDIRYSFNGPSWSLSCEAFFYGLFPLALGPVLARVRRSPYKPVLAVVGALVLVAGALAVTEPTSKLGWLLYSLPAYRFGEFLIGMMLAAAMQRGWRPLWSLRQAIVVVVGSYAVLMAITDFALGNPERLPYFVADLWMLPAFLVLIAAGAASDIGGAEGALQSSWLVRLGRWSFALYLVHELLLRLMQPVADRIGTLSAAGLAVGTIALAVLISGALHEWFETPLERRLRRMTQARPEPVAERVS